MENRSLHLLQENGVLMGRREFE